MKYENSKYDLMSMCQILKLSYKYINYWVMFKLTISDIDSILELQSNTIIISYNDFFFNYDTINIK